MKRKILIVEDNVGLSQMQKDWLLQAGYEVTTAIDEPAARRLLRRTAFDLILSDVRLPEGDGISLLEWTREERMTTPYIVMTEYATVSDAVRAIRSGAKDYLPKPVHKERLLEMADEILRPLSTVRRAAQRTRPVPLFRPCQGSVHGSRREQGGILRHGRGRHAVSGRNRYDAL